MGDEYLVKTHIFEGPLDTLLSLIEKRKLFINDISLAQVADDYIAYIKSLNDFPIAEIGAGFDQVTGGFGVAAPLQRHHVAQDEVAGRRFRA